jgi:hypothetical protein
MAKTLNNWFAEAKGFPGFFAMQSRDRLSTTTTFQLALSWQTKQQADLWAESHGGPGKWNIIEKPKDYYEPCD